MENPEFSLEIPEFWTIIEHTFSIEPEGIRDIKVILTLLKYTTVQSITKFTKQKEIQLLELEFVSRRHDWVQKFPRLANFSFGSGLIHILQDIAMKVKKKFINQQVEADFDRISENVLADGRKVFFSFYFYHY